VTVVPTQPATPTHSSHATGDDYEETPQTPLAEKDSTEMNDNYDNVADSAILDVAYSSQPGLGDEVFGCDWVAAPSKYSLNENDLRKRKVRNIPDASIENSLCDSDSDGDLNLVPSNDYSSASMVAGEPQEMQPVANYTTVYYIPGGMYP
jgi:hypothetical protein